LTVPLRAKLEVLLDFYDKKPRVSLTMLMYIFISLVLPTGLNLVER